MRKKDTFTKRISYEYNELDTIAEFLEEKAAEGWELTSKTGVVWGFRRSEPRKVKFNVEVVESDVTGDALWEFISFCEADGWKHVFDAGNIQIFENEDLDADPIHTDPEVKLKIVHEKCKAMRIFLPLVASMVILVMVWKAYFPLDISFFESSRMMGNLIIMPLFCCLFLASTVDYFVWYRKAKHAVEIGESPQFKRSRFSKILDTLMLGVLIINAFVIGLMDTFFNEEWAMLSVLLGILIVGVIGFWILFPKLSAKYNKSKASNDIDYIAAVIILLIVVLFMGPLLPDKENTYVSPLTLENLGVYESGDEEPYLRREKSPALTYYEYAEDTGKKSLYYEMHITKWSKVYDLAVNYWTVPSKRDYEIFENPADVEAMHHYYEVEEPAFGADKVLFSDWGDRWLLLYPDRVIRLHMTGELTDDQKALVAEKLTEDLEAR